MPIPPNEQASVYECRHRLMQCIRNGYLGQEILDLLLPCGEPHLYERQLWDYKLELPSIAGGHSLTDLVRQAHNAEMAEIVKDAVAFYNSLGGYLVIGVRNSPRTLEGFVKPFDCDDLNKRIQAATKQNIECHYKLIEAGYAPGRKIGILYIPQRRGDRPPAQFLRDAPPNNEGHRAYKKDDIYYRTADSCRPAKTSDEYAFLFSADRCRSYARATAKAYGGSLGDR